MRFLNWALFSLVFIASAGLFAQDSQGTTLMERAEASLEKGKKAEALEYFRQAESAFGAAGNQEGRIQALLRTGYAHLSAFSTDKAKAAYREAAEAAREAGLNSFYREAIDALATIYFMTGAPEKGVALFQESIALAEKEGDRQHQSTLMVQLGDTYRQLGRLDSARLLLQEALQIKTEIDDTNGQALALNYLGIFYYRLGDYQRALDYYLQTLEKKEAVKDSSGMALMLKNISSVFIGLEDWEKAAEYAERSYRQASQLGLTIYRAEALSNLARIRLEKGDWQQALSDYQKVAALYRQSGNKLRLMEYLLSIGHIYLDQNQAEEAEIHFREAAALAGEVGEKGGIVDAHLAMAQLFIAEGRAGRALPELRKARALARENGMRPKQATAARLSAAAFKASGDFRQALECQEAYSSLRDSLDSEQQKKLVYELETRYQVADKEKQIGLLNTENELQALRLQESRRRTFFLVLLLGIFAIATFLAVYAYRTKQGANRQLAEKNELISKALAEKELLLREIHHRVKNNLQMISGLLKLQSAHLQDDKALAALSEGRSRVQAMALIHQNLYQEDELTGIYTADYIPKLIHALFDSYNILPGRIEMETDIAPLRMDVDTAIPLGLILNELIANALKHAFPSGRPGQLKVALREESGQLQVQVRDNGIGMPESAIRADNRPSFGLQLIELLAEKLKAQLSITSGEGTSVLLSIQNYKLV